MLTLNLLPPKEKRELRFETNRRFAMFAGVSGLMVLSIFAILLFSTKLYIDIQLEPLEGAIHEERERAEAKRTEEIEKEIQKAREQISHIAAIQQGIFYWSSILKEISRFPLEGIIFSSIALGESGAEKNVKIVGYAEDRDHALLGLEEAIKSHPRFYDLDSPSSNWIKERDINFVFSFKIR